VVWNLRKTRCSFPPTAAEIAEQANVLERGTPAVSEWSEAEWVRRDRRSGAADGHVSTSSGLSPLLGSPPHLGGRSPPVRPPGQRQLTRPGEATLITWRWHGELAGPISSKAWNDRRVFENRWKDECRQADVPPSRAPDLTSPHPLIGCACQALLSQTRREEVRGKARVVMGCGSADGDPTKRLM
jgi:hypothetical protein